MPSYEYECTDKKCGHIFEKLQRVGAANLTLCPKCKHRANRVVSRFSGPATYTT